MMISEGKIERVGIEIILTTLMPWFWALIAKTRRVEMMTHARGAPADTQNNFGFFMLCMYLFTYKLVNNNNNNNNKSNIFSV